MPGPKQVKSKLGNEELRRMQQLTGELQELLHKIAQTVQDETGTSGYNVATVVLPSAGNPLQIAFQNSRILNVLSGGYGARAVEEDEIGYYIDPPGVCTTIQACIPE